VDVAKHIKGNTQPAKLTFYLERRNACGQKIKIFHRLLIGQFGSEMIEVPFCLGVSYVVT